jgi:hypothetical protein
MAVTTPPPEVPRPTAPAPAWTTSEFWSMLLVQGIAVSTIVVTFVTGSSQGLEGTEAIVPAAALLLSAAAHVAYVRGRVHIKLAHLGRAAGQIEADVRAVEPLARQLVPVVMAEDPALAQRVAAAVAAGRAVETSAKPATPEAPPRPSDN